MSSHLRSQAVFAPFSAHTTEASFPHNLTARPEKRQKMSITQTYRLAHRARGKLSHEASRGDHDLRLLVGHANLLDGLMLDLQQAEKEQETWFNNAVAVASKQEEKPRVTFVEQHRLDVPDASDEEAEEEAVEDSDSEYSDSEEQTAQIVRMPSRRQPSLRSRSPPARVHHMYDDDSTDDEEDDDAMESDDEMDSHELALVRTRSHSSHEADMGVPELVHDSSDESDDESAPSSPSSSESMDLTDARIIVKDFAAAVAHQNEEQKLPQKVTTTTLQTGGFYLPPSEEHLPMVAAY